MSADRACALYAEGYNLREIGERLGFSHEWARQLLLGCGIAMRSRGCWAEPLPPLAEEIADDLEDHFPNGATVEDLTAWLGESEAAVQSALNRLASHRRLTVRAGRYYPSAPAKSERTSLDYDPEAVCARLRAGELTFVEIAAEFGITKGQVAGVAWRSKARAA